MLADLPEATNTGSMVPFSWLSPNKWLRTETLQGAALVAVLPRAMMTW